MSLAACRLHLPNEITGVGSKSVASVASLSGAPPESGAPQKKAEYGEAKRLHNR